MQSYRTRAGVVLGVTGMAAASLFLVPAFARPAMLASGAGVPHDSRIAELAKLKIKFEGAATCGNCHAATKNADVPTKDPIKSSQAVWDEKDPHRFAFATLAENPLSKTIADAMKLGDPSAAAACLDCHAVNVPKELQGAKFDLAEGNSCNACHGPSTKWNAPHVAVGWTEAETKKLGHDGLLKQWGLYNTGPAVERAQICVACHLQIPAEMVAAGHPQTTQEIAYDQEYSPKMATVNQAGKGLWRHWNDEPGLWVGRLWAAGQVINAGEGLKMLAARAADPKAADAQLKDAYDIAMGHVGALRAAEAGGLKLGVAALKPKLDAVAAAYDKKDKAALATAAKAAADAVEAKESLKAINALTVDVATAKKVAAAIAADVATVDKHGFWAAENYSKSLSSLFEGLLRAKAVPEVPAVVFDLDGLIYPESRDKFDAAEFKKKLAEVGAAAK